MVTTMHPIIQLMRFDKPIGIWLLFLPAGWAVAIAAAPDQIGWLLLVMLVGAVLTRAAGCILNDLADRKLDAQVERTKHRPLAAGTVKLSTALVVLFLLLCACLLLVSTLPTRVFWLSLVALPMIASYPFMKRFTWWPQLFLGFTFNLGVLFGWLATGAPLTPAPILLYLAGVCWTLGYDTIYAVQDMADDASVGIKSTARRVGAGLKPFVGCCYAAMLALFLLSLQFSTSSPAAYAGAALAALHAAWQWRQLPCPAARAGALFRSNQWLGLMLFLGLLLSRI